MAITIAGLLVWFHQAASHGFSSYYTNGYIFAPFMYVVTVSRSKN